MSETIGRTRVTADVDFAPGTAARELFQRYGVTDRSAQERFYGDTVDALRRSEDALARQRAFEDSDLDR